MPPIYKIIKARREDISSLPAIELAAAQLLLGHAPKKVLEETTSQNELQHARRLGLLWLALHEDRPVGFAHVKLIEPNAVHLQEIDVHPEHGRRGVGTKLIREVYSWGAMARFSSITLTTFRGVTWNMPWYLRFGFEVVSPEELSPALLSILREEKRRGLDPETRVAMRRLFRSKDRGSVHPVAV
jgi:GNAT superfamily N-acetyltransferase